MSKQYLMICGEEARSRIEGVLRGVEFLEVQGMNLNNENKVNILVTPIYSAIQESLVTEVAPTMDQDVG